MKKYNLIFLRNNGILLSKKKFNSCQEIQNEYDDYTTSLQFDSLKEINDYISFDYHLKMEFISNQTEKINNTDFDIELIW